MSTETDTAQTTQQATPFLPNLSHLQTGFDEAARLYGQGTRTPSALTNLEAFYNGDPRLTDIWNRTSGAANQLSDIATGRAGYTPNQTTQDFMSGRFLDPETNPWLKGAYEDAAGAVRGQINSTFAGGGRYGSGANQEVLGANLGKLANTMYGGAYQQGQQQRLAAGLLDNQMRGQATRDQMQAATLYPTVARSFLQDPMMLAQIQQQQIDAPWTNLQRFMGAVNPGINFGSTTTSQQPVYSNPFGEGVGAAGSLLLAGNLAANLFGNPFASAGASAGGFDASGLNFGNFGNSWGSTGGGFAEGLNLGDFGASWGG